MDSLDINTRLPPRKRLLAGLKKENSDCEFSLPIPSISSDLCARLRDVINSPTSSPEEIIEASMSVALAAAEVAAAARATAMEKAAAAAKAKSAAKNALELLDLVVKNEARKEGCPVKNKSRKKHVQIKLLYENNQPVETDEELARRLHRAMNSSPRISKNSHKRHGSSRKWGVSDRCSHVFSDSVGKLEEKFRECSRADCFERKRESNYTIGKQTYGPESRGVVVGKKAKVKRKKLPLSQFDSRDLEKLKELPVSVGNALTGETKLDYTERNMSLNDAKPSNESEVSMKITSMWKFKKLKVSQCYSDRKMLHGLCSNPSSTETSAMV